MTARATKSNAPLRREQKKGLKRIEALTAKYTAEGLTEVEARKRASAEARDNPRKDYRRPS